MPFDSQVLQLSTEQLDQMFDSSPSGTPSADTLTVGKDNSADVKNVNNDSKDQTFKNIRPNTMEAIPFYNDSLDEVEEVKDEKVVDKEPIVDKVEDTTDKLEEKDEKPTEEVKELDKSAVNEILTNTVDYLISSGRWVDFEGREDLEMNEEVYAELTSKQDEHRLSGMFNELIDSTGDYGKAIISHIKNGGNPDEIIDLFKEQKQLQQIDTSTEVGKQAKIEKYYSEVLGWKPEKVEKTIKRLVTDDEIESEFADVEELYDKHFKQQLAEREELTKNKEAEDKRRQLTFVNNIKSVLNEDTTMSVSEKKLIQSSITDFKHNIGNGQKVNDFYIKFAEQQADPKEYVDLVRFVMDKENYLKSLSRKEKTKANSEAFSFIKGNAAVSKVKSSSIHINDNPTKSVKGTDFSFAAKNK